MYDMHFCLSCLEFIWKNDGSFFLFQRHESSMYDVIICINTIENRKKSFFQELTAGGILSRKAFEECRKKNIDSTNQI